MLARANSVSLGELLLDLLETMVQSGRKAGGAEGEKRHRQDRQSGQ